MLLKPAEEVEMLAGMIDDKFREHPATKKEDPFRVEVEMRTPLVMGHRWIHFDSLLAHLVYREVLGELFWLLPSKYPVPTTVDPPVPLAKHDGIWKGSVSFFSEDEWSTTTVYKRFPTKYIDMMNRGKKKRVNIGSGRYRNWMIRLPYLPVKTITFYGCGDSDRTRELLRDLPSLGKKAAYGFGKVHKLTVRQQEEDWSLMEDGRAQRPIPVRLLSSTDDQLLLACKPPYWDKASVELCAPPGAHIELR